jgi:4-hydroxy-3-methylbut-2-enyl diphosphate reductase
MDIFIAKSTGFCSGVQRAIKGAEEALKEEKNIYCLGEIIHNPEVVGSLKKLGMVVVDEASTIPRGSKFIIRSHGLQREIIRKAQRRGLKIFDFTCPKVKKIHRLVKELTLDGYHIFIIGNPQHPEVKAVVSLTEGNATVINNISNFAATDFSDKTAVVVQTTFNPQAYLNIVDEIILSSKKILVYNTLCEETIKRQKEALQLAGKVDHMVVVGGKNSSNTKTLYQMVKTIVPAVHIEGAHELEQTRFQDVRRVGIISGASTPEEEVMRVRDRLLGSSESDDR